MFFTYCMCFLFPPPNLTMMHLRITHCTYWTPLDTDIHTCLLAYIHAEKNACIHTQTHTYIHTLHIHIRRIMRSCTHTYTHTHTQSHTRNQSIKSSFIMDTFVTDA